MQFVVYSVLIATLSFAMSLSIGANDAANALGTSYGSSAAKLTTLLVLGAIFEFVGSVFCSSSVAGTLADNLLPTLAQTPLEVQSKMMLGVSIASFGFIMGSSVAGMPVSGTHTVIGALIGAGLAADQQINWRNLGRTVFSWFLSPLLACVISGFTFVWIASFMISGDSEYRLINVQLTAGISMALSTFLVLSLT
jgi:inorganic phosphate transporter, PiT family